MVSTGTESSGAYSLVLSCVYLQNRDLAEKMLEQFSYLINGEDCEELMEYIENM